MCLGPERSRAGPRAPCFAYPLVRMLGISLGIALLAGLAPTPDPVVSWDAPPGCPDAAAVHGRIEALLGRVLASDDVRVDGRVAATGAGFTLRLRVTSGGVVDERQLTASRCEALGETAALVAAVMVDPEVIGAQLETEPPPQVPEPEAPGEAGAGEAGGAGAGGGEAGAGGAGGGEAGAGGAGGGEAGVGEAGADDAETLEGGTEAGATDAAPVDAETEAFVELEPPVLPGAPSGSPSADGPPPVEPAPSRDLGPGGLWARVQAGGEFGAIPGGTGGLALTLATGGPRMRGELQGAYWVGRPVDVADASARIHLGHASARVCGMLPPRPVALVVCGGFELGAMRADVTEPAALTRHQIWLAAHAEAALRWQVGRRIALWVGAQPFVPIVYPRFELDAPPPDGARPIHAPTAVGVRGLAGIEIRAWSRARRSGS